MKISDIDKLCQEDVFIYKEHLAQVKWKRPKDDSLSTGTDEIDKSVCLSFDNLVTKERIVLVSRLDSKMARNGCLYELDLPDYSLEIELEEHEQCHPHGGGNPQLPQ